MSTANATHRDWTGTLASLIEDLRRLDLKIDNDTRFEPAPNGGDDQVNSAIVSRTRITSQGRLVAEFEYSGRIRLWHQWHQTMASAAHLAATNGQPAPAAPTSPVASAPPAPGPAAQDGTGAPPNVSF